MFPRPVFLRARGLLPAARRLAPPAPWFSKIGPVCWYRDDWFTINLTVGPLLIARVHRGRFGWMLAFGGRVRRWSIYGHPTEIDALWRKDFGAMADPLD